MPAQVPRYELRAYAGDAEKQVASSSRIVDNAGDRPIPGWGFNGFILLLLEACDLGLLFNLPTQLTIHFLIVLGFCGCSKLPEQRERNTMLNYPMDIFRE